MENLKEYVTAGGFLLTLGAWFVSYGRLSKGLEALKESLDDKMKEINKDMDSLRAQSKEHYEAAGKIKEDIRGQQEKSSNIEKILEKMDAKLDRVLEARKN